MALLVERAGPVCWAIEKNTDGTYRKRLLLPQDPLPLSALASTLTEEAADRWIERNVREEEEASAFAARQLGLGLFDEPTPAEVGAQGAAKALEAASAEWREDAWRWILARKVGATITSDDLTEAVGLPPAHPHAVGGIIKNAATAGYLAKTGAYVESRRESCRGAALAVWARTGAS
ncbi:MAG: hypothetical protein ABFD84_07600 [Candidatus Polarisedimenticolia bacterium]